MLIIVMGFLVLPDDYLDNTLDSKQQLGRWALCADEFSDTRSDLKPCRVLGAVSDFYISLFNGNLRTYHARISMA